MKLKDDSLKIHLKGDGGFGRAWVNLKFNRPITCETLTDPAHMLGLLDPLFGQTTKVFGIFVVSPFLAATDAVAWPYDANQLRAFTIAEFKTNGSIHGRFQIVNDIPKDPVRRVYTLSGEIVSWSPGDRATRMIIGLGAGRESAEIHYWVMDDQGHVLYEHRDTIRAELAYNAYAGSVGQLARPLALKLVERVTEGTWQEQRRDVGPPP